jgi:hypothetical protein
VLNQTIAYTLTLVAGLTVMGGAFVFLLIRGGRENNNFINRRSNLAKIGWFEDLDGSIHQEKPTRDANPFLERGEVLRARANRQRYYRRLNLEQRIAHDILSTENPGLKEIRNAVEAITGKKSV